MAFKKLSLAEQPEQQYVRRLKLRSRGSMSTSFICAVHLMQDISVVV